MYSSNEILKVLPDATVIYVDYDGVVDKTQVFWEYRGKALKAEITPYTTFWECRLDDWYSCWRMFGSDYSLSFREQLELFVNKIDEWIEKYESNSN